MFTVSVLQAAPERVGVLQHEDQDLKGSHEGSY